jgi:hypothetical protein
MGDVYKASAALRKCGKRPLPAVLKPFHAREIIDANVTGGNVVNFERVGSNRKEWRLSACCW